MKVKFECSPEVAKCIAAVLYQSANGGPGAYDFRFHKGYYRGLDDVEVENEDVREAMNELADALDGD